MKEDRTSSKFFHVLAALVILAVVAGLLGARLAARSTVPVLSAPGGTGARQHSPAAVPSPPPLPAEGLEVPHWSSPGVKDWPLRFRTDLDLLAPLGTGDGNAAAWFKDFVKDKGARYDEAAAAMQRRSETPGGSAKVLPPDDPLLLEAEPWCDQASMRFYPEYLEQAGFETPIPNLLLMLTMAKSWVARGNDASDPAAAMEDYRRAIRLGRLLRQEDVVVINDLVGLVCIREGAQAMYDLARKRGDMPLALAASVVLGEVAPQRLLTAERLTASDISGYAEKTSSGTIIVKPPDEKLDRLMTRAKSGPDRRFRLEAILQLHFVCHLGVGAQKEKARALLDELAASPDIHIAKCARWCRDTPPSPEYLDKSLLQSL
jgi:hypothetical protein